MPGDCGRCAPSGPPLSCPEKEQVEPKASGDIYKPKVRVSAPHPCRQQPQFTASAAAVSDPKGSGSPFAVLTSAGRIWRQMKLFQEPGLLAPGF